MLRTPSRAWGLVLAFWVALAAAQEAQTSSYFRATGSNGGFEIGAAGSVQVTTTREKITVGETIEFKTAQSTINMTALLQALTMLRQENSNINATVSAIRANTTRTKQRAMQLTNMMTANATSASIALSSMNDKATAAAGVVASLRSQYEQAVATYAGSSQGSDVTIQTLVTSFDNLQTRKRSLYNSTLSAIAAEQIPIAAQQEMLTRHLGALREQIQDKLDQLMAMSAQAGQGLTAATDACNEAAADGLATVTAAANNISMLASEVRAVIPQALPAVQNASAQLNNDYEDLIDFLSGNYDSFASGYEQLRALINARYGTMSQTIIAPSELGTNDNFGRAIATYGNTMAVAAAGFSSRYITNVGAVFIIDFDESDQSFSVRQIIEGPYYGSATTLFANDVALYGDTLVVGAPYDDENLTNAGAAYVYRLNASNLFELEVKLSAPDQEASDYFGRSVAISDRFLAIGAPYADDETDDGTLSDNTGVVYLYQRSNASQSFSSPPMRLFDTEANSYDYLGLGIDSIAINGNFIVLGAYAAKDETTGVSQGQVLIFRYYPAYDAVRFFQRVVGSTVEAYDYFGASVDLGITSTGTHFLAVGAYGDDGETTTISTQGAVYIFQSDGRSEFTEVTTLRRADASSSDYFGYQLAFNNDATSLAVTTRFEDVSSATNAGGISTYARDASGTWGLVSHIVAEDASTSDYFGQDVAYADDYLAVGAYLGDKAASNGGQVYTLFNRNVV